MSQPSILIFDSGIGGLSIALSIRTAAPWIHINYIADIGYYPYGTKSGKEISTRVKQVLSHAIPKTNPDVVVIACNTASTIVLDELRESFSTPFVGVVPAIKPAVAISDTASIGILATKGTVTRHYTKNLIAQFAHDKNVFLYGSTALVNIAEEKLRGEQIDMEVVSRELKNLTKLSNDIDTIVLACTHFPIIKPELSKALPHIRHWVDSGTAIAKRTIHCLELLGYKKESPRKKPNRKNHFLFTDIDCRYHKKQLQLYLGSYEDAFLDIKTKKKPH